MAFLAFRWDSHPRRRDKKAIAMRPPTTASPTITPVSKRWPSFVGAEVVEFDVPSMTLCLTHSPNEHGLRVSPFAPNNELRTAWPNAQVESAWQVIVTAPSSLLIAEVRFLEGNPPQKVALVMHVHLRFWHSHLEGSASVTVWAQESAVQKNCSVPS